LITLFQTKFEIEDAETGKWHKKGKYLVWKIEGRATTFLMMTLLAVLIAIYLRIL